MNPFFLFLTLLLLLGAVICDQVVVGNANDDVATFDAKNILKNSVVATASSSPSSPTPYNRWAHVVGTLFLSPTGNTTHCHAEDCSLQTPPCKGELAPCTLEAALEWIEEVSEGLPILNMRLLLEPGYYDISDVLVMENVGNLTIVGPVADKSTAGTHINRAVIDRNYKSAIAIINGTSSVKFENMHFHRGGKFNETANFGTAVTVENGAYASFQSCHFKDNLGVLGGAIRFDRGTTGQVIGTLFQNNTAEDGGVVGFEFDFSKAYGSHSDLGGAGGAVCVIMANVTLDSCVFEDNKAGANPHAPSSPAGPLGGMGGAVAVFGKGFSTHVVIRNAVFKENLAEGIFGPIVGTDVHFEMGGMGGALHVCDSKVDILSSKFLANVGTSSAWWSGGCDGGAAFVRGLVSPRNVLATFVDCVFEANIAFGSTPPLGDYGPIPGTSGGEGGAIMILRGTANFKRCIFQGNVNGGASKYASKYGMKALWSGHDTVAVATTRIVSGEVHFSAADFDECVFKNNFALSEGLAPFASAIAVQSAYVHIYNCYFESNVVRPVIDPTLDDPTKSALGAVYIFGTVPDRSQGDLGKVEPCRITNSTFRYNVITAGSQKGCGAAITVGNANLILTNCLFESNEVHGSFYDGGYGGALCVTPINNQPATVIAQDVKFIGNRAGAPLSTNGTGFGGAVAVLNPKTTFVCTRCSFEDNAVWIAPVEFSPSMESRACSDELVSQVYDPYNVIQYNDSDVIFSSKCTTICSREVCDDEDRCIWDTSIDRCTWYMEETSTTQSIINNVLSPSKNNPVLLVLVGLVLGIFVGVIAHIIYAKIKERNMSSMKKFYGSEDEELQALH